MCVAYQNCFWLFEMKMYGINTLWNVQLLCTLSKTTRSWRYTAFLYLNVCYIFAKYHIHIILLLLLILLYFSIIIAWCLLKCWNIICYPLLVSIGNAPSSASSHNLTFCSVHYRIGCCNLIFDLLLSSSSAFFLSASLQSWSLEYGSFFNLAVIWCGAKPSSPWDPGAEMEEEKKENRNDKGEEGKEKGHLLVNRDRRQT